MGKYKLLKQQKNGSISIKVFALKNTIRKVIFPYMVMPYKKQITP